MNTQRMPDAKVKGMRAAVRSSATSEHTTTITTLGRSSGGTWLQRAIIAVAGLTLVGAISLGLTQQAPQERAETIFPVAHATAAAGAVTERYRDFKTEQAVQRADALVARRVASAPTINPAYRSLKNEQVDARLAQAEAARWSVPGRVSAYALYQTLKEREALARADSATILASLAIPERYRDFKDLQVQRTLDTER
jgi:hypothetical protein